MINAKSFLKSSLQYCIPSIVSAIIAIAVIPIISRVYPAEEYGKINMFYSVGNMLLYIVLLGMDSAYIRFYFEPPKGINRRDIFSMAFWTSIIMDVLLGCIAVFGCSKQVAMYLFGEKNIFLIVLLFFYVIGLVMFRLFSIESRMEKKAILFNVQQIVLMVTNRISYVFIAFFSTKYDYAIISITICTLLFAFVFALVRKRSSDYKFSKIEKNTVLEIYKFALPCMPTMLMTWINNSIAKMILSGYGDFYSVGILTIATSLANVFSIIPSAFCVYWSPFVYSNYKTEQDFIKRVHNYIIMLSIFLLLGIFWMQDLLYIFVGGEYKLSQSYFMFVMLTPIQSLLCETTSYGIALANKTKYNLYISIVAVIINISFGLGLYHYFGIYGVVFGIAISAVFQLVAKTVIGQKFYNSIMNWKTTFFGISIILFIIVSNLCVYDNILLKAIVSGVVILLFVFIFKRDLSSMVRTLNKMLKKEDKRL